MASRALMKRMAAAAAMRERERARLAARRERMLARRPELAVQPAPAEPEVEVVEAEPIDEPDKPVTAASHPSESQLERAIAAMERRQSPVQRIEIHDPERSSLGLGFAIGLAVVAVLGVGGVVLYLLLRKKDAPLAGPELRVVPYPVAGLGQAVMSSPATPLPEAAAPVVPAPRTIPSLVARSYRLPALTDYDSGAVRIGQATDVEYEVIVRTIGPPGEWAVISFNPTELMQPGMTSFPVGDVLTLPAGQWQKMRLLPRQVLYAKGSVDEVVVSVTMNERLTG